MFLSKVCYTVTVSVAALSIELNEECNNLLILINIGKTTRIANKQMKKIQ